MGSRSGHLGLDFMVDRRRAGACDLFSSHMGNVSQFRPEALSHPLTHERRCANSTQSMSNRRGELEEMTALYLIPIVAVVIVATSGGIVANALPNQEHRLWTLIVSFILWGLGSPLSWIILTIYLLRLILHKPVERAVIVSLLLPIGPLGLSGFR